MIRITIETNEIDVDVCFFQKNMTYKNVLVCGFFLGISLLVCEFKPYRQTSYQKFIGTYLSALELSKKRKKAQVIFSFKKPIVWDGDRVMFVWA